MKATTVLLALGFLFTFTSSISLAQQEIIVPQYQHLRDLEPFIGEWEGRFDPPGSVPAGSCHVSAKWTGYKAYVHFKVTFIPDGTEVVLNPTNVFVGFSGKTQRTHAWALASLSQASTGAAITKGKLVMEGGEGFTVTGKTHSRTTTYELRSADELVVTNTNVQYDGKDAPDGDVEDVLVLKRIKNVESP